ncbi:MAG TPA: helix-turn-helix domain-containing protein [Trueperaceae bacterium]|nr:helix-turn-helix domain-containing protein [Trueperaceae bacterium]
MSRFGQYCPVAAALDVLGERWTLLIVRDLLDGPLHFNEMARGLPRMSRTLLAKRLQYLEGLGLIERCTLAHGNKTEYALTEAGASVRPVVESLLVWGATWAFDQPDPDDLDPLLLMWWMRRRVRAERLPALRTVVQFGFNGIKESYWLVLKRSDVSVCLTRPPFDVDLWVTADLAAFFKVWLGRTEFGDAVQDGSIELLGDPNLERAFPTWFAWSPAASVVRAVA